MLNTAWAVIRHGKIELTEPLELTKGAKVLVTVLPQQESQFWLQTSQNALASVWDNAEDDVYAHLLEK